MDAIKSQRTVPNIYICVSGAYRTSAATAGAYHWHEKEISTLRPDAATPAKRTFVHLRAKLPKRAGSLFNCWF